MTPDNVIKAEIVSFAFNEAGRSGDYNQMLAVACVLANRRKKGWHGGDWMAILKNAGESAALEPRPREMTDLANPIVRRFLQAVDDIYSGIFADDLTGHVIETGGKKMRQGGAGLYYVDAMWNDYAKMRPWFQEKILGNQADHQRVAQVGMLYIFS